MISVLREYNNMKEEIINPENAVYCIVEKQWKHNVSVRTKKKKFSCQIVLFVERKKIN